MRMMDNPDVTWTQASAAVWSTVELNVGLICNCVVTLKPFVKRHFPRFISFTGDSHKIHTSGPSGVLGRISKKNSTRVGYQLESIDRPSEVGLSKASSFKGKGIIITHDYAVHSDSNREIGDGDSTEDIIPGKPRQ